MTFVCGLLHGILFMGLVILAIHQATGRRAVAHQLAEQTERADKQARKIAQLTQAMGQLATQHNRLVDQVVDQACPDHRRPQARRPN